MVSAEGGLKIGQNVKFWWNQYIQKDWQQNQAGCIAHYGHHKEKLNVLFDSHGTLENILKTSICRHNFVWILPVKSFDKWDSQRYFGVRHLGYTLYPPQLANQRSFSVILRRGFPTCRPSFGNLQFVPFSIFFGGLFGSTLCVTKLLRIKACQSTKNTAGRILAVLTSKYLGMQYPNFVTDSNECNPQAMRNIHEIKSSHLFYSKPRCSWPAYIP